MIKILRLLLVFFQFALPLVFKTMLQCPCCSVFFARRQGVAGAADPTFVAQDADRWWFFQKMLWDHQRRSVFFHAKAGNEFERRSRPKPLLAMHSVHSVGCFFASCHIVCVLCFWARIVMHLKRGDENCWNFPRSISTYPCLYVWSCLPSECSSRVSECRWGPMIPQNPGYLSRRRNHELANMLGCGPCHTLNSPWTKMSTVGLFIVYPSSWLKDGNIVFHSALNHILFSICTLQVILRFGFKKEREASTLYSETIWKMSFPSKKRSERFAELWSGI